MFIIFNLYKKNINNIIIYIITIIFTLNKKNVCNWKLYIIKNVTLIPITIFIAKGISPKKYVISKDELFCFTIKLLLVF